MGSQAKPVNAKVLPIILPEIRSMIDQSRHHVATTADLTLVHLYWNIGRVITQDIQKNEKRAGYGEQLLGGISKVLTQEWARLLDKQSQRFPPVLRSFSNSTDRVCKIFGKGN